MAKRQMALGLYLRTSLRAAKNWGGVRSSGRRLSIRSVVGPQNTQFQVSAICLRRVPSWQPCSYVLIAMIAAVRTASAKEKTTASHVRQRRRPSDLLIQRANPVRNAVAEDDQC